jgi:hypothetical protein
MYDDAKHMTSFNIGKFEINSFVKNFVYGQNNIYIHVQHTEYDEMLCVNPKRRRFRYFCVGR